MRLPKEFWKELPQKDNVELCAMLREQDDYLPEAIAAVKVELRKRNLTPKNVTELATAVDESRKNAAQAEAHELHKRRMAKYAFYVFFFIALTLFPQIKKLISMLLPF